MEYYFSRERTGGISPGCSERGGKGGKEEKEEKKGGLSPFTNI